MIKNLTEEEYLGMCRKKFHETSEEKQARVQLRKEIKQIAKAATANNEDYKAWWTLYQAINGIIRCALGLRAMTSLKYEDIPKASNIAKQVLDIIKITKL